MNANHNTNMNTHTNAHTSAPQAAKSASSEYSITISRRGSERIQAGLPWIYRSDVKSPPTAAPEGAIVRVLDGRQYFCGRAFWSTRSQIALRMLTTEDIQCDEMFFVRRIEAAKALRERMFPGLRTYRLIHADADLLPGIIIDRYESVLTVQLLTQGADRARRLLVSALRRVFSDVTAIVERSDARVRDLEGLLPVKGTLFGEAPEFIEFPEGDIVQRISLLEGQKTGGFLDQRENHLLAAKYAFGDGLDCFSYTGGFALQMAKHGCSRVTAVELSEPSCALIAENARLNGLNNVDVRAANAFDFLKAESLSPVRYDTVVLDPPAFAKGKDAIESALRGYKEINLRAMQLLRPGGFLITASCSHHVDEAMFEEMLVGAANDARRTIQVVEKRGAGRDHPARLGMKESRYLKCFFLRVL